MNCCIFLAAGERFTHSFYCLVENDGKDSSFLPNEMLLGLFHGCLQHDLSDREITLLDTDHVTFMEQVLQRDRDGHPPPFKLSVVQGKRETVANSSLSYSSDSFLPMCFFPEELPKASIPSECQNLKNTYHSFGTKDTATSASTYQVR